ncbi:MAG: hypothetical protein ACTTK0_09870 [Stomatobaculum sp.]
MVKPISDYPAFFDGARAALSAVTELKEREERLKAEEVKSRADLASEEKALKDAIELTVKTRIGEITDTYDGEIAKGNEALRRVQARRERARSIGVKERIKEETRSYIEEAAALKKEMRETFREKHVPGIFRSKLYYTLYFPHTLGQWFSVLLFIAAIFVAVPCGIYFLALPEKLRNVLVLIVIYVADILIFGGLYTIIGNASKLHHMETLKQGRELWDRITRNQRQVKKIRKQISRDKSEDKYDLAAFDDEISHITQNIQEATAKKQEALNTFETVTKTILTDELTQNARPRIEQLTSTHALTLRMLQEVSAERQKSVLNLAEQYEVYVGREFMTEERLAALAEIMREGTATNLSEAIEEYKRRQD